MAVVTFASKLNNEGSLTLPEKAVAELGIYPGDEVRVQVETTTRATYHEEPDQARLQAQFDHFFDNLDTLHFEKTIEFAGSDPAEAAYMESMDEKYR